MSGTKSGQAVYITPRSRPYLSSSRRNAPLSMLAFVAMTPRGAPPASPASVFTPGRRTPVTGRG